MIEASKQVQLIFCVVNAIPIWDPFQYTSKQKGGVVSLKSRSKDLKARALIFSSGWFQIMLGSIARILLMIKDVVQNLNTFQSGSKKMQEQLRIWKLEYRLIVTSILNEVVERSQGVLQSLTSAITFEGMLLKYPLIPMKQLVEVGTKQSAKSKVTMRVLEPANDGRAVEPALKGKDELSASMDTWAWIRERRALISAKKNIDALISRVNSILWVVSQIDFYCIQEI